MNKKLYNVVFPIWMLLLFPMFWLVALPANLIIDTIVLLIALKVAKVAKIYETYKGSILKMWLFGFVADIIGGVLLLATQLVPSTTGMGKIISAIAYNPFDHIAAIIIVVIALVISAVLIYFLNMRFNFKNDKIDMKMKKRVCLILAIFTAPYMFLCPAEWIYHSNQNASPIAAESNESEFLGDTITAKIFAESKNYTNSEFTYINKIAKVNSDIVESSKGSIVNMKISTEFDENTDMNLYKEWAKECSIIVFIKQPSIDEVVVNLQNDQTKDLCKLIYTKQEIEKEYQVSISSLGENAAKLQEILNSIK